MQLGGIAGTFVDEGSARAALVLAIFVLMLSQSSTRAGDPSCDAPRELHAVAGWSETAWWVGANGDEPMLRAEKGLFESIQGLDGFEERLEAENSWLRPIIPRHDVARWLEEQGIRVVVDDRDSPGEFGRAVQEEYVRVVEAWKRRLGHGGEGTPTGSYWADVVPVDPFPESGSR